MMRILHLIPRLSGGGAETQLGYLAPELARMGHEVHIAYVSDGPIRPDLPGVVLHRLKSRSSYDPYLLWQLLRLTRRLKLDVLHTWILQSDVLGAIVGGLTKTPWILREPGSAMAHPRNWKNRLRIRAGNRASAIVSNSLGGDSYWRAQLPNSRRYCVRNGLPVDEIDRTVPAWPAGHPRLSAPIALYVGRLASDGSASKNLRALLESLKMTRQKREVFGVICGDGPQRLELEEWRRTLGLEADVVFTGYLRPTAVWALMKMASVFLSLSAYEGAPNTVMEAMACGCPTILSDIPAHREILTDSDALFVDPSNIPEVASRVIETLDAPGAAQGRGHRAKQKTQAWSVAAMARNYEKIYREIA